MSTYDINLDENIELETDIDISVASILEKIESDPKLVAMIEKISRNQSLKMARRVGNTSGKYAQRQLPQGVINQNPSTKRIF